MNERVVEKFKQDCNLCHSNNLALDMGYSLKSGVLLFQLVNQVWLGMYGEGDMDEN